MSQAAACSNPPLVRPVRRVVPVRLRSRTNRAAKAANRVVQAGCLLSAVVLATAMAALPVGHIRLATTHGISMLPSIHTGDLAIVRPAGKYHLGDVVAYRSLQLHAAVLHRIVATDGTTFTLKGDHNTVADREAVSKSQIIGRVSIVVKGGLNHIAIALGAFAVVQLGLMRIPDRIGSAGEPT